MSPVIRANLLLVMLIVAAGWLLWQQPGRQQGLFPPITSIDTGQVRSIRILHQRQPWRQFARIDGRWRQLPSQQPVENPAWIERLLHIARLPSLQRFSPEPGEAARYGLNPPAYTLWLDHLAIEFGGISPISRLRYVRVGDSIHLVSDGYTHYLQRPPDA